MTVSELATALREFPYDTPVVVEDCDSEIAFPRELLKTQIKMRITEYYPQTDEVPVTGPCVILGEWLRES